MTFLRSAVACIVVASACVGAGGFWLGCHGDSQCAAGADPDRISQDCPAYATARCALEDKCIADPGVRETACETTEETHCRKQLGAPNADATRVERCTAALPALSCDDYATGKLPSDCYVPPGIFDDGTACTDDLQCKSASCYPTFPMGCGICAPTSGAGGPCPCAPGLVCETYNIDGPPGFVTVCGTPAGPGQSCDGVQVQCARGLDCAGEGSFVCAPRIPEGGSCADVFDAGILSPRCETGLACEDGGCVPYPSTDCSAQCAPQACTRNGAGGVFCYTPGTEGEPCSTFERVQGARGCADGLVCDTSCATCNNLSGLCAKAPPPPTPASCARAMGLPAPPDCAAE